MSDKESLKSNKSVIYCIPQVFCSLNNAAKQLFAGDKSAVCVNGLNILINLIIPSGTTASPLKLMLCLEKKLLSVICEDQQLGQSIVESIPTETSDTVCLMAAASVHIMKVFGEWITAREKNLSQLECTILDPRHKELSREIIDARRTATVAKRYADELKRAIVDLTQLLPSDRQNDVSNLLTLSETIAENALFLRDLSTQVREAYQTRTDMGLNGTMKFLAAINTIFLPLMLIAGWYGMNIKMPEMEYANTYPIVIGVCALIVVVMTVWFSIKKWF